MLFVTKHIWHYLAELSSIALAHLSQYFSIIIAPSVLYLTNLVASSPHPIQNLEFFSELDVKGSILFNVFSNNYIFSNYRRKLPYKYIKQLSVSAPRLLRFKENGIRFFHVVRHTSVSISSISTW